MDMRAMEFQDGTFDCVIDKATLDSTLVRLLCYIYHCQNIFYIVWGGFSYKCSKDVVRNQSSLDFKRSLYCCFLWTART